MIADAKKRVSCPPAAFGEKYFKEMTVGQVMDSDKFQEEYEKWRIDVILGGKRRSLEENQIKSVTDVPARSRITG